jgi:alpha-L-fucosidase
MIAYFSHMTKIVKLLISALLLLLHGGPSGVGQAQPELSQAQQNQVKRGYGMFIHFGLNTFNETEWSDGTLPVSSYNPDQLDCDQWIKTAREAGFRYVILITKHHDGFCLWDSKYTDYDVGASPVKTDIVGAVAKACKKYGLELGLYYSLWDRHEPSHKSADPQDYVDYMKNQLSELLTNYGTVAEIWFDGAWAKKSAEWHVEEIYNHIKKLQPDCLVTINHTIGKRDNINAIGQPKDFQEGDPIRFFPVDFRTKDPNLARWDDPKWYRYGEKNYRLIFEHTLCLSDYWNWFQKKAMIPARPVDELEELFYWCTANDNILIINIPPDEHGLLREHERLRIFELADRLGIRNQAGPLPVGYKNLSFLKPVTATSADSIFIAANAVDYSLETWWKAGRDTATIEIDLGVATNIDRITIFEKGVERSLPDGFTTLVDFFVRKYSLEWFDGKWKTIYQGDSIGRCRIIRLPEPLSGSKLRLKILASGQPPGICHIGVASSLSGKVMGFKLNPISVSGFSDSARQVPVSQSGLSDPANDTN